MMSSSGTKVQIPPEPEEICRDHIRLILLLCERERAHTRVRACVRREGTCLCLLVCARALVFVSAFEMCVCVCVHVCA